MVDNWAEAGLRARHMAWSAPLPLSELDWALFSIRLYGWYGWSPRHNFRMTSILCNEPTVTGFSVGMRGNQILALHAHRAGDDAAFYRAHDDEAFYRAHDDKARAVTFEMPVWFYLPINPGEVLRSIWFCPMHGRCRSTLAVRERQETRCSLPASGL